MIEQMEISNVAKETLDILNYFEPSFVARIPTSFIELLKKLAQGSTVIVKVDKNKALDEQNILEETKDLLSLIYYYCIAGSEEKKQIEETWNKNELLYQQELRRKYDPSNIFEKDINENIYEQGKNTELIEYKKDNFFEKILKKVRSFIKGLAQK